MMHLIHSEYAFPKGIRLEFDRTRSMLDAERNYIFAIVSKPSHTAPGPAVERRCTYKTPDFDPTDLIKNVGIISEISRACLDINDGTKPDGMTFGAVMKAVSRFKPLPVSGAGTENG